jgi:predicted metal-binding protein
MQTTIQFKQRGKYTIATCTSCGAKWQLLHSEQHHPGDRLRLAIHEASHLPTPSPMHMRRILKKNP